MKLHNMCKMNPSVKKLGKFNTKLPKKGAFTIETEPEFPKLHTLCIASGKRGGGKSIAIANFIKSCKDKHYYDRVFLIPQLTTAISKFGTSQTFKRRTPSSQQLLY